MTSDSDHLYRERRAILLLGGTGFIGHNLATASAQAGHRVLVAVRGAVVNGDARTVPAITQVPVTLDDPDAVEQMIRDCAIDTVVHLVSSLKPSSGEADYMVERDAVMTPTLRLAGMLARLNVRLVYFSSGGAIYGSGSECHAEDDPCAPISFYGQSKLEIETHLRFLARTAGLRYVTIRPSNPYGAHQQLNGTQGLISVLLSRSLSGQPLEVWGDGSSVRDYIHVDDLVSATLGLIERDVHGVTLNIGSGVGHSLLEVVQAVETVTGHRVPLMFHPARATDVRHLVLNVDRIRQLGLYRTRTLSAGIRDYAAELGIER